MPRRVSILIEARMVLMVHNGKRWEVLMMQFYILLIYCRSFSLRFHRKNFLKLSMM